MLDQCVPGACSNWILWISMDVCLQHNQESHGQASHAKKTLVLRSHQYTDMSKQDADLALGEGC